MQLYVCKVFEVRFESGSRECISCIIMMSVQFKAKASCVKYNVKASPIPGSVMSAHTHVSTCTAKPCNGILPSPVCKTGNRLDVRVQCAAKSRVVKDY